VTIDYNDKQPKEAYMWLMAAAHANSTFNPLLFYYFNSQIERIFNNYFRRLMNMPIWNSKYSEVETTKTSKRLNNSSSENQTLTTKIDNENSPKNVANKNSNKNGYDFFHALRETVV